MEIKKIIRNGHVAELNTAVFGQKLESSSVSSFVRALNADEEIELIMRLLSDENPANWMTFLHEYRKHYPLCNQTINLLIDKMQDELAMKVLTEEFERYGYTEQQATKICNKILALGIGSNRPLLMAICTDVRIFYSDVFSLLLSIDNRNNDENDSTEYADVYQKSLRHYREVNNMDHFYEQKAPTAR